MGVDIDVAAKLLVSNLKGRGVSIREDDLFWYSLDGYSKEEKEDFIQLRDASIIAFGFRNFHIPIAYFHLVKFTTPIVEDTDQLRLAGVRLSIRS